MPEPEVLLSPALVTLNQVGRVVVRGDDAVSEVWVPGRGWVEGGTIAEVAKAPPASPARLEALGVPL